MGNSLMAKGKLTTQILDESAYPDWIDLVEQSSCGSIYSRPDYLDILCEATGGRYRILGVYQGEQLLGGIGLYESQAPGGLILSNRLLLYYNSIVTRDYETRYPSERTSKELAILGELEQYIARAGYAHTVIHCRHTITDFRPFLSNGWSVRPSYSYIVWIDDIEQAYGRIEQNLRRLIKRSEQADLTVAEDDDFESFFDLHYQTHQRKGSPVYLPKEKYRRYIERLRASGLGRLYHVRLPSGQSVASQLVLLGDHPVTHTVCAAADPEHMKLGTTPFLRWKVLELLAADGYYGNDLTDATLNEVTRFKSQLGGELVTNFVLGRPDSTGYKLRRDISRLASRGRSIVGRILRGSGRDS